ncbi:MAG TPA: YgeY family selenium metabolism-linked hydrolase [Vicinamibacterales bacterium]|jgi:putative selenium metabolism hydrolase
MREKTREVAARAAAYTGEMTTFLRDMIAIPSESAGERAVVACVAREMRRVGFDEVKIDGLGNVLGRVGEGPVVLAIDGHLDTVGVGDASTWRRDPYRGELKDGVIYGRGASDQEAGIAAAVHGARIAKELGLLDGVQVWVTGTVMEEDCDGLCWQYILREGVLKPEVVVITEPTNLNVYRGHRGRMEMEVRTQGLSCHGSAPERGVNAVYTMAPIVADIERLNDRLAESADQFLGKGSVTIAEIRSTSPSLCAVADSCTIHLDRRLTRGETLEKAVAQIGALESVAAAGATVTVLDYARESYTGLTYPTKKYYPTWVVEEADPAVRAAVSAAEQALHRPPVVDKWTFSTNGIATCGLFGVPTVGFGPANEIHAHTPEDQCPVEHLTLAAAFYAVFGSEYLKTRTR